VIRVLLADDQALIRAGFAALVESAADMTVVGEATNGAEAVAAARSTRADVILMDIRMPELDGLAATRAITADDDLAGVRIIILTTFEVDQYVVDAIRAGASGFLDKGVEPAQLLDAIRSVAAGDALLTPRATRALLTLATSDAAADDANIDPRPLEALTAREAEVVALVGRGLTNETIAEQLFLSPLTVKTHVNRAMMKLGARDRAQLAIAAFKTGLTRIADL
jgi:DNA-binding NarL/FixJ family response regulator